METVLYKRHPVRHHLFCGSNGEIWSNHKIKRRFLTRKTTRFGYVYLRMSKGGIFAHRLICEAFHGIQSDKEVNHINSIRNDNRPCNLEWVTKSQNALHSFRFGYNTNKGDRNPRSKLKSSDIQEIKEMRNLGMSYVEISKKYGVHPESISAAYRGKTWK